MYIHEPMEYSQCRLLHHIKSTQKYQLNDTMHDKQINIFIPC